MATRADSRAATVAAHVLVTALCLGGARAQSPSPGPPLTVPEQSGWTKTSTHDDVRDFVRRLAGLPAGGRLEVSSLGESGEQRELTLVIAADPPLADAAAVHASGKLRVLVNANIHGGEVEGKEAVQMLLREIANGEHSAILASTALLFVPNFNPDGNDRISTENRRRQNGPAGGVGERHNAADLDLNRDFIKATSPEVRGMLRAFREFDPHLFMDLHTTNGSHHGYHLTYAPSLSPNVDPALDRFQREAFLPEVRDAVAVTHSYRVHDYGILSRREPRRWATYDHRPRFGTNYCGLRNRLAVLSEAYSYRSFEERIRVTRAFVLENLAAAARHSETIQKLCAAADQRCSTAAELQFGFATTLASGVDGEILVGTVHREGDRVVAEDKCESVPARIQVAFESKRRLRLPRGWALVDAPAAVLDNLLAHGLQVERLTAAVESAAEVFVPTTVKQRTYQGMQITSVEGEHRERRVSLPVGTLLVRARQPLARLAAQLLEAQSEDSLLTWNFLDGRVAVPEQGADSLPYPIVRLPEIGEWSTARAGR